MRYGYVEAHVGLVEAFKMARRWIGNEPAMVLGPSTSALGESSWLLQTGVPLGVTGNRRSQFAARPSGVVIGWCLNLREILDVEDEQRVSGLVAIRAHKSHSPWTSARAAERLGGEAIEPISEAADAVKRTVQGISSIAVLNQGLADPRERSAAVQAMTYLRQHGYQLDPQQLIVEALRNDWPRQAPIRLAEIAKDLNSGKRLRYTNRVSIEALAEWCA